MGVWSAEFSTAKCVYSEGEELAELKNSKEIFGMIGRGGVAILQLVNC